MYCFGRARAKGELNDSSHITASTQSVVFSCDCECEVCWPAVGCAGKEGEGGLESLLNRMKQNLDPLSLILDLWGARAPPVVRDLDGARQAAGPLLAVTGCSEDSRLPWLCFPFSPSRFRQARMTGTRVPRPTFHLATLKHFHVSVVQL